LKKNQTKHREQNETKCAYFNLIGFRFSDAFKMGCKPNEEVKRTLAELFLERFKTVELYLLWSELVML